jgi:hypothetical protein
MSKQTQSNFYPHLDNCLPDICAAGCLHAIFDHGWEACEKANDLNVTRGLRIHKIDQEIAAFEVWQRTAKEDASIAAIGM